VGAWHDREAQPHRPVVPWGPTLPGLDGEGPAARQVEPSGHPTHALGSPHRRPPSSLPVSRQPCVRPSCPPSRPPSPPDCTPPSPLAAAASARVVRARRHGSSPRAEGRAVRVAGCVVLRVCPLRPRPACAASSAAETIHRFHLTRGTPHPGPSSSHSSATDTPAGTALSVIMRSCHSAARMPSPHTTSGCVTSSERSRAYS